MDAETDINRLAAEEAFRSFLAAFGMKDNEEIMDNTPRRVVEAYAELFTPKAFAPTVFHNEEHYDELVLVRSIPLRSVCEHHFLPFVGTAHVAYLPDEEVIGLSKLARVVETYSRRPQRQERLTVQVAQWLEDTLRPRGVGVLITARHSCMTLRGARADNASTVTSAFRGTLTTESRYRADFFSLLHLGERAAETR
ncbi:GTP cyclohydrolase [Planomonospora sphaerica]|uniref:GTP cyclohydrolase 1 n=1 Tax=Planomonospora sphaerica TaxID=161355 RepID=A0A171DIP8_9ACTN|nr:GTP cyclohydrolase I [Planomonospora sphaerica]GAT68766.1 GTP cyclohydrolase [Planomonospora sphaerica]